MAINIKKVNSNIQQKIVQDYKNGKSMRQIEKDYGVTRTSVAKFLTEIGVKTTTGNHYRRYYHNFDFFEKIDTEEKAYWLGFMYADGYICDYSKRYGQDRVGMALKKSDEGHLLKFKKSIEATNPINYDNSDRIGEPLAKIELVSQKTVDDLINQGCEKQKTLKLKPPENIPQELLRHFIRGFFDGDGSLTRTTTKNNKIMYGISIVSNIEIIEWLQEVLQTGSIVKEKRRENCWYLNFGGNKQVLKFCNYLYENSTVYLDRKYERYLELKNKYSEN